MYERKTRKALAAAMIAIAMLAGCAGTVQEAGTDDPQRGTIVVSSKEWTEPLILGELTMQYLDYLGYDVEDRTALGPTPVLRAAMKAGEIDTYWEYTSTILVLEAGLEENLGMQEAYDSVKSWDLENNNIVWGAPTTANNTYVLITKPEFAEEVGFSTTSELAEKIKEGVPVRTFFGLETFERPDGVPGLEEAYGFEFDRGLMTNGMSGLDYEALNNDEADVAMGLSTQGQIMRFGLMTIEDDKGFFPPYMPCYIVRGEALEENPLFAEDMDRLVPFITNENLMVLNDAVNMDERSAREVAREFLLENGLIDG